VGTAEHAGDVAPQRDIGGAGRVRDACDLDALSRRAARRSPIAPGGLFLPGAPAGPPMMRVHMASLGDLGFARFMQEAGLG
jgi:hypothetical protein